ncbi:MAG: DUF4364 family protein [Lachnospiraceae bacterium]|nr:DUF4364 family protein [Lachnospiraceae bacterium]
MSEPFTLYKLIILYMLSKVNFSLSNGQITDFILDKEYTDYLTLQQALAELLEVRLIHVDASSKDSLYHITEEGLQTLGFFENRISDQIKEDITSYIQGHGYELYDERSVLADFCKNAENEYAVRCRVMEKKDPLIDLTITVPTLQDAEQVCRNWEQASQPLYAHIIKELLK